MAIVVTGLCMRLLHWLSSSFRPFLRRKLSGQGHCPSNIKNSRLWAKIFYNSCAADRALVNGVNLALIGRIHDIGNKKVEKPYLLLVPIPPDSKERHQQRIKILPFIRGIMKIDSQTNACTFDFPKFILNVNGVYDHERVIPLPATHYSQFSNGKTNILYYSSNILDDIRSELCIAPNGSRQDVILKLNDRWIIQLRCSAFLASSRAGS